MAEQVELPTSNRSYGHPEQPLIGTQNHWRLNHLAYRRPCVVDECHCLVFRAYLEFPIILEVNVVFLGNTEKLSWLVLQMLADLKAFEIREFDLFDKSFEFIVKIWCFGQSRVDPLGGDLGEEKTRN